MEKFVCNTENAISRVSGILKDFIVNIIRVIAINVNSVVKKVTLPYFPQTLQSWRYCTLGPLFLLIILVQNFMLVKSQIETCV